MTKHTKLLQFPPKVRKRIEERDEYCIFCLMQYDPMPVPGSLGGRLKEIAHFANKSKGGLGIEQNGVLICDHHHGILDNGRLGLRDEMLEVMKAHLMDHYPDWNEEDLYFKK